MLLLVLGVLTFCQTFVYYDLETLYADTIAKNPSSWTAYANLSMHYITVGRKQEAYALAERAVELAPNDSLTNGNLAALLLADVVQGDDGGDKLSRATSYFQKSVSAPAREHSLTQRVGLRPDESAALCRGRRATGARA